MSKVKLILKICFYALTAFILSKLFFDMSITVMIFVFFSLYFNDGTTREKYLKTRKRSLIITSILVAFSFIGIVLIIVGEKTNQDMVVILGTFIFAPSFSGSITVGLFTLIRKLEMKIKKEKIQ